MASFKFLTSLNETRFFKSLREKLQTEKREKYTEPENLLVAVDNHLLVWDPEECVVLLRSLIDTQDAPTGHVSFKKFVPSDPPLFDVKELVANAAGSHIVLFGSDGVACLELPPHWRGKVLQKQETIIKSFHIGENLINNPRLNIVQVAWHPGSSTGTHIAVLTSDNCIRIFDVNSPSSAEKVVPVGSGKNASFRTTSTFSARFGEAAVAFDFGQPVELVKPHLGGNEAALPILTWPVYVLLANGDVYTFNSSLHSDKSKVIVNGPLAMWPAAEDNYCNEACSLICLPTSPPLLVIGTRHWTVHHAMLLPRSSEDLDSDESGDQPDDVQSLASWSSLNTLRLGERTGPVLNVVETLELDADILDTGGDASASLVEEETDSSIRLMKDPSVPARYFISHSHGVHLVAVPLVLKLAELVAKRDEEVTAEDTKVALAEESLVEFLLVTRTRKNPPAPPLGLIFHPLPPCLLILLNSFNLEVVLLSPLLKPPPLAPATDAEVAVKTEQHQRESFEAEIRRVLQRHVSQPKLRLPENSDPSPEDVIKLFSRCVQILRDEYMNKQDLARDKIERRTRVLSSHLQQQLDEVTMLHESKNQLTESAHRIAERYEDCRETQERLMTRIEKVLLDIQRQCPVVSDAEKQMAAQLKEVERKLKSLSESLNSLRRNQDRYETRATPKYGTPRRGAVSGPASSQLTDVQQRTLRETLAKQNEDIAALVRTTKLLAKELKL